VKVSNTWVLAFMLLAGCAPNEQLIFSSSSSPRDSLARVRVLSMNKVGTDPYKLGVGSKVVEIIHNGAAVSPKSDVVQLKQGTYTIKVAWWRITKDTSFFIPSTAGLIMVPGGSQLNSDGTYNFDIQAKPGYTYVVDVQSTVEHFDKAPESLCITEEPHDAPGVTYPAIGKAVRYPSVNAVSVSCASLTRAVRE